MQISLQGPPELFPVLRLHLVRPWGIANLSAHKPSISSPWQFIYNLRHCKCKWSHINQMENSTAKKVANRPIYLNQFHFKRILKYPIFNTLCTCEFLMSNTFTSNYFKQYGAGACQVTKPPW